MHWITNEDGVTVSVTDKIQDDLQVALAKNFPDEQLPDWSRLADGIKQGWITLHELRSKTTGELLSVRVLSRFPSRFRGDPCFAFVAWAVTPDPEVENSQRGKSRGYGSYLFAKSQEIIRHQMPNAIALVGECERVTEHAMNIEQRNLRRRWMASLGRLAVFDLDFEIPPLPRYKDAEQVPASVSESESDAKSEIKSQSDCEDRSPILVADRGSKPQPGELLMTKFDGSLSIDGMNLYKIVERLYMEGYDIIPDDPYLHERMALIDRMKQYQLAAY